MNSNSVVNVLIGVSVLALIQQLFSEDVKEDYFGVGPPQTIKTQRVVVQPGEQGSMQMYDIPGNWQMPVAPRFQNLNLGAYTSYNLPASKNMAAGPDDYNPQGFARNLSTPQMSNAPVSIRENYGAEQQGVQRTLSDAVPVQAMSGQQSINALGETMDVPVVYDRNFFANQKSRLYAQADPIRGDLPIMPTETGWFRPSVNPSIDLNSGSLAVVGGVGNTTNQQLLALQSAARGGVANSGSGIGFTVQSSPYMSGSLGDVSVTAFP